MILLDLRLLYVLLFDCSNFESNYLLSLHLLYLIFINIHNSVFFKSLSFEILLNLYYHMFLIYNEDLPIFCVSTLVTVVFHAV